MNASVLSKMGDPNACVGTYFAIQPHDDMRLQSLKGFPPLCGGVYPSAPVIYKYSPEPRAGVARFGLTEVAVHYTCTLNEPSFSN